MLIIDRGNLSALYCARHSLTSWCQRRFPSCPQISAGNIHFCTKGTHRGVRVALSGFRDACTSPMTDLGVLFSLQWHHWWFLLPAFSELSNVVQTPVLQEIRPSSVLEMGLLVAQLCLTLQPHGPQPTRLLCPWDFPGKDTRMVCHFLLQGIFLTQRLNLGLLHYRQIFLPTELPGKPKRWEAYIKTGLRMRRGFGNWRPIFLPVFGPLHLCPGTWWKQVAWLTEMLRYLIAGSGAGMSVERTVVEVLSLLWRLCPYFAEVDFWTVLWQCLYP